MSTFSSQDNFAAYIVAGVVLVAIGAIFTLFWNQNTLLHHHAAANMSYATLGPYQVETQKFEISATVVVETGEDDSRWAQENKSNLDTIFKMVLARVDPQQADGKNNVEVVQNALRDEVNQDFHNNTVAAVLLTDFSLRSRE